MARADAFQRKRAVRVAAASAGVHTRAPTNHHKKVKNFKALPPQKSRSRLINNAVQIEFFGGGHWQQVVSPDGVVTNVTRLWPMSGQTAQLESDGALRAAAAGKDAA
jgi:hypothetical protein